MAANKPDPRRSIYIRDHLKALLESGRVPGKTDSQRIDRLVARYDVLVRDAYPKRVELTAPELLLLAEVIGAIDISEPDLACMIPVKLQQRADEHRDTAADPTSLAYRLRNLRLGELLAVVDLVERLLATGQSPTKEDALALLTPGSGGGR